MFSKSNLNFAIILCWLSHIIKAVNGQCNRLTTACPPALALGTSKYYIDFTQQTSLPPNWTVANYETVTFGPNGAAFTFAKRYDAPYIWTQFHFHYGHVETVMQAAPGTGMISSSVLISDDLDEIDWEWSGNNFGTSTGKVQTNYYGKGITGNYDRGTQPSMSTFPQTTFHTYTVDWTPTTLTWSVDGSVIRTMQNGNANSGAYQYPQTPMRVQLGLWDGGDADTPGGTVGWAGGYTDLSKAPFTMYVKSIKITTPNPCSGNWQYTDKTGSDGSIKCVPASVSSPSSTNSGSITPSAPVNPTVAPTAPSAPLPSVYTVVSGDTGYGIAAKLGIPFTSLAAVNPTVDWDLLLLGQILQVLPGGTTGANSPSASSPTTTSSKTTSTSPATSSGAMISSTPFSGVTTSRTTTIFATSSTSVAKTSSSTTFISASPLNSAFSTTTALTPPLSPFSSTKPASTGPSASQPSSTFAYTSCYTDNILSARALNALSTSSDTMTVAVCASFCSGYTYMGLEYGRECYCGNTLMSGSTPATDGRCSMSCAGNSSQVCGGPYGLSLYKWSSGAVDSQPPSSSSTSTASMTTKLSTSLTTAAAGGYVTVTSTVTTTVYACATNSAKLVRARGEGSAWWPFFG